MGSTNSTKKILEEIGKHLEQCRKNSQQADLQFIEKKWEEAGDEKYNLRDGVTFIHRMINEFIRRKDEAKMEKWMEEDDKHEFTKKGTPAVRHFSRGEEYYDFGNKEKALEYFKLAEKEQPGIVYKRGAEYSTYYLSQMPHIFWSPETDKEFREQIAFWKKKKFYLLPIKVIEEVPESERTPDLIVLLAECYDDYAYFECEFEPKKEKQVLKKALELLNSVEDLPKNETLWLKGMSDTYLLIDDAVKCLYYTKKWLESSPSDKFIIKRIKDLEKSIEKDKIKAEKKAKKESVKQKTQSKTKNPFGSFKFTRFWNDDEYALDNWVGKKPTDYEIEQVEKQLGYKLPEAYIWLMKKHNGGVPRHLYFVVDDTDSITDGYIKISGIYGIDSEKDYSLCGKFGNKFLEKEWGYPDIGVVAAGGESGGHDMIYFDYRVCGKDGEPSIVYVDQEAGFTITPIADNFVEFIKNLVDEEEIEEMY